MLIKTLDFVQTVFYNVEGNKYVANLTKVWDAKLRCLSDFRMTDRLQA